MLLSVTATCDVVDGVTELTMTATVAEATATRGFVTVEVVVGVVPVVVIVRVLLMVVADVAVCAGTLCVLDPLLLVAPRVDGAI